MNYASVQKGLKAVLTPLERRPLPSPPASVVSFWKRRAMKVSLGLS